jgi:hypothetical protein
MIKCLNIVCTLLFALNFLVVMPAAADDTPPGGLGEGDLVVGEAATTVSIIAPNNITDWLLSPGSVNARASVFTVSADGDWYVKANDSDSVTNGRMTESDDGSYINDPKKLANPMNVSVESGGNVTEGYDVKLPNGGMIARGGETSGAKNVDVTFKQPVLWSDGVLTDGHRYKIVVTFTISPYS